MSSNPASSPRDIALDIHKHYALVAAVDREGQVLLKPRQVTNEQLPDWAKGHLFAEDMVVIESTTNAWHVYDLLAPLVAEVKVANPIPKGEAFRIKQSTEARTKTDKRDALILARLLAVNLIPDPQRGSLEAGEAFPEVWVPPVHVRELRQLTTTESVWRRKSLPAWTCTSSTVSNNGPSSAIPRSLWAGGFAAIGNDATTPCSSRTEQLA